MMHGERDLHYPAWRYVGMRENPVLSGRIPLKSGWLDSLPSYSESPVNLVLENCTHGNWRFVNSPLTINFADAGLLLSMDRSKKPKKYNVCLCRITYHTIPYLHLVYIYASSEKFRKLMWKCLPLRTNT